MDMTYLARQPILSKTGEILGYEILFRDEHNLGTVQEDSIITSSVVSNIVNIFGIENVIGKYLGFIKVNIDFLEHELFASLPKERFVFSLFDHELVNPSNCSKLIELSKEGHRFAINDTSMTELPDDPALLKSIDYIKIDTVAMQPEACDKLMQQCRDHSIEVIASKVETHEVYDALYSMGAHYFQGYYLSKPKLFENATIRAEDEAIMQIWNLLNDDASTDDIVDAFEHHHALAVQLLRFINSAFFSMQKEITSIRHLIVLLGRKQLSQWLMLLLFSQRGASQKNSHPLLLMVINRTEIMTGLLCLIKPECTKGEIESAYLVGMLSLIHLLFHMQHREILNHL
ncbi:MAG: EAL domain-containing protein, partial [Sulfurimonadaceae bacterium]|nr:EAL domain-containing protein [Sulfurimonadaceae bacterium]